MKPNSEGGGEIRKSAGLGIILSLVPLGITLGVYDTGLNPGLPIILGGVLAFLVGLGRVFGGDRNYHHWGVEVAFLLLLWASLSQVFGCLDQYLGQKALASFVGAVAMLALPQLLVASVAEFRFACHVFLVLVTATCAFAWPPLLSGEAAHLQGTFANPDTFAVLPLFAAVLSLGLVLDLSRKVRWLFYAQLIFLVGTLWATGCRAAMVGFGVACIAFFGLVAAFRKDRLVELAALLGFPLLLALFALPLLSPGSRLTAKLDKVFSEEALVEHHVRLEVAAHAWRAALARPVFGGGIGCFGLSYQEIRPQGHDHDYINIAHNDHLEIAVELGVPGFILWLALFGAALAKPYKGLRGRNPVLAGSLFAGVVAFGVYSCFNFILAERPALWAGFYVLGLALACPTSRKSTEPGWLRVVAGLLLIGLACWAVFFGYRSLQAEILLRSSIQKQELLLVDEAISDLRRATEYQPGRLELWHRLDAELKKVGRFRSTDNYEERRSNLTIALENSPRDVPTLLRMADLLLEKEEFKPAVELLESAARYAPYHSMVEKKRVAAFVRQEDFESAARVFEPDLSSSMFERRNILAIFVAAELARPGSVSEILGEWHQQPGQRKAVEKLLNELVEGAFKRKQWNLAAEFVRLALSFDGSDLCLRVRMAGVEGQLRGFETEFEMLGAELKGSGLSAGPCFEQLVARWSTLGLEFDRARLVRDQLAPLLKKNPRSDALLVGLAEAHHRLGDTEKAFALVRDGLAERGVSVPLLVKMGELYEAVGAADLARNYYKDALRLEPKNSNLTRKLRALK